MYSIWKSMANKNCTALLFFLIFKFHGGGWVLIGFSHFNAILVIKNAPLCSTIPNSSIQSILKIQLVEEANQLFGSADHFLVKVGWTILHTYLCFWPIEKKAGRRTEGEQEVLFCQALGWEMPPECVILKSIAQSHLTKGTWPRKP